MAKHFKAEQGELLPAYWYNGKLLNRLEHGSPQVATFSQAMDYSVVIIEGIRVNVTPEGKIFGFRLNDHIQRMLDGWKELGLKSLYRHSQILEGLQACINKNLTHLKGTKKLQSLYIRPKIFHSDPVLKPFYGQSTNVVIECFPLGNYLPGNGISATVADYVRTYRYSGYTTKGAGKYPEYGSLRDVSLDQYDDVLQLGLGKGGKLIFTEGTSSNLFFVMKGKLLTPGADDFILKGITRDSVIKMAKKLEIKVIEAEVPLSTILECDEVFLTGTASFLTPITQIGQRHLGTGPVTKKLADFFNKVRNGKVPEFKKWLTPFNV